MRRNHLDAVAAQLLIEWIAVVSAIADEVLWLGLDHVEVETGLNQTHRRIDALNYTMMHDDGQLADDLEEADVVLIGVSRTSKTPTSIYLANRGVKTANIPLVPGVPLPAKVEALQNPLVVSWWLAACVLTESGKPWRSTIAMIFRPFPRFVAPISAPPPLAIAKVGSLKHSSSLLSHRYRQPDPTRPCHRRRPRQASQQGLRRSGRRNLTSPLVGE
jgi:Kinase/pyrophosphorylase